MTVPEGTPVWQVGAKKESPASTWSLDPDAAAALWSARLPDRPEAARQAPDPPAAPAAAVVAEAWSPPPPPLVHALAARLSSVASASSRAEVLAAAQRLGLH